MSIEQTGQFFAIRTDRAPSAIGPYSQGFVASGGQLVFTSGQIGLSPITGRMIEGGVSDQTRQAMENLREVLKSVGGDLGHLVKVSIFVKNMDDFATVNTVYASFLGEPYPARETVEVSRLPLDALVEISGIAMVEGEQTP